MATLGVNLPPLAQLFHPVAVRRCSHLTPKIHSPVPINHFYNKKHDSGWMRAFMYLRLPPPSPPPLPPPPPPPPLPHPTPRCIKQ
uniref:Uncharacterized protein n=1 Tax=Mesocestoides corti TaxID=53468 RepID=A0A5K3G2S4_MESCO